MHKESKSSADNYIRLVAIDLDGTLLDNDGNLPPRGSRLVKVAFDSGIHIIISTTRNYLDVLKFCTDLGIHDPIICSNGAYIFEHPTGNIWQQCLIPLHVATKVCQIADENSWELSISASDTTYLKQRPNQKLGRLTEHPYNENIEIVPTNQAALLEQPHRILTWHPQAIKVIEAVCSGKFKHQCRIEIYRKPNGAVHSLGLYGKNADKGTALQFVSEKLGVEVQNVMAIGDNENDLPMFDCAKFKVAMGNATDNVKQAATIIAPSHEDEGVAWILENFVLLNRDIQGAGAA